MNTTPPTDTAGMEDRVPTSDPGPSHWLRLRTAAVVAGAALGAGVAAAVSATPSLAFISNQHNETLVRSPGRP